MLKKLVLGAMLLWSTISFSQWNYDYVVDALGGDYKIAYARDTEDSRAFLKLEVYQSNVIMYIQADEICGKSVLVSAIFVTPQFNREITFIGLVTPDETIIYLERDMKTSSFLNLFKQSTEVVIKVTTDECVDRYFQFFMSGSTAAYNFMSK